MQRVSSLVSGYAFLSSVALILFAANVFVTIVTVTTDDDILPAISKLGYFVLMLVGNWCLIRLMRCCEQQKQVLLACCVLGFNSEQTLIVTYTIAGEHRFLHVPTKYIVRRGEQDYLKVKVIPHAMPPDHVVVRLPSKTSHGVDRIVVAANAILPEPTAE